MSKRGRACLVAGVLAGATASAAPAADPPRYAGSRALCDEHVTGNAMHIHWSTAATTDELPVVLAFYEKALGKKATVGAKGEPELVIDADRRVSFYPASKADAWPSCGVKPTAGEKTVILISQAIR